MGISPIDTSCPALAVALSLLSEFKHKDSSLFRRFRISGKTIRCAKFFCEVHRQSPRVRKGNSSLLFTEIKENLERRLLKQDAGRAFKLDKTTWETSYTSHRSSCTLLK